MGLLLLHGFTGGPSSWARVRDELPSGTRLLTPQLVGHGIPAVAPNVASFQDEVERLVRLVIQEDEGPWLVAGYSLGARLALGVLISHPQHFQGAVLVSGRAGLESAAERELRAEQDERWCRVLQEQGLEEFVERWEAQGLFATQECLSETERASEKRRRMHNTATGLIHSLRTTGLGQMPNFAGKLAGVGAQVELLAGALDPAFCAHARSIVRGLPRGQFTSVPAAGHNLLLERPSAVAEAIVRGLQP